MGKTEKLGLLDVDESKITPLDKKRMAGIFLCSFADQFSQLVIMPFLPPLCEMFFPEAEDVGVYVGILQSLFYFTQFFAAPYWGTKSDTIGRRPVFLVGLAGVIIGMLLVGFAESFFVVCLSRMVAAGLCVTPVVAKTYIGEITDHSNQHRGFAVIGVSVGITTFIAPLVGGYLAQPAENYDSFDNDFWAKYPYLLPCLVAILFTIFAILYAVFYIPESEAFLERKKERDSLELTELGVEEQITSLAEHNRLREESCLNDQLIQMQERGETALNLYFLNKYFPPIARTKTVGLAIIVFTFHAMITIIFDTMFPVFCEAPYQNNGLNLSVEDTGILLSIKGLAALIYQATVYPKIGGKFGARTAIIWCLLCWSIILFLFPLTSSLAYSFSASFAWYFNIFLQIFRAIIASTGAMALMMIINNSVPPSVLGKINGVSTSCSSASRCIGPLWSGAMWTGSVTSGYWRLSGCMMYWCLGLFTLCAVWVAHKMPMSLNMPMGKKRKGMMRMKMKKKEPSIPERDY